MNVKVHLVRKLMLVDSFHFYGDIANEITFRSPIGQFLAVKVRLQSAFARTSITIYNIEVITLRSNVLAVSTNIYANGRAFHRLEPLRLAADALEGGSGCALDAVGRTVAGKAVVELTCGGAGLAAVVAAIADAVIEVAIHGASTNSRRQYLRGIAVGADGAVQTS